MSIWQVLASILLMGNIDIDDSQFDESNTPCKIKNPQELKNIT